MKAKESLKWFGILLLVFLLGISCMTMTALASGGIDLGQEGVLNLYFGENGTGFSEVAFSIYRVASVFRGRGLQVLTSDFGAVFGQPGEFGELRLAGIDTDTGCLCCP